MKNILIVIYILINVHICNGQTILIGEKSYPSTNSFSYAETLYGMPMMGVSVGKDGSDGILYISLGILYSDCSISGGIKLFLKDQSILALNTVVAKDKVNERIIIIYKISADQISDLLNNEISSIRISLRWPSDPEIKKYEVVCSQSAEFKKEVQDLFLTN